MFCVWLCLVGVRGFLVVVLVCVWCVVCVFCCFWLCFVGVCFTSVHGAILVFGGCGSECMLGCLGFSLVGGGAEE